MSLQVSIETFVVESGWKAEYRSFHPHLTLGRVKNSREVAEKGIHWGNIIQHGVIPVNVIHLIESKLTPKGARYSIRHSSRLRRGNSV